MSNVRPSVRGNLIRMMLVTTAIALFVSGAALLVTDLSSGRAALTEDLETQASILSLATAPSLSFDDPATAKQNLASLRAKPSIRIAALYAKDGHLYAQYGREGGAGAPPQVPRLARRTEIHSGHVDLLRPVIQGGEKIGTVYLSAEYDIASRVWAYVGILALVFGASLAAAFLVATRMQREISEPLDVMTRVARDVVEKRDYSLRAQSSRTDEFGLVLRAFNKMLDEVEARARALQVTNGLLTSTEQALRDADRRKDEFLATLAHELRNPLAPIRNAVRILEAGSADENQKRWGRQVISRQVHNMALLLDDLLDVSRITRGKLELKKDYVELRALLDSALETARPLIDGRKHKVAVQVPAGTIHLEVDPLRMAQVIGNLLTNAAKYTDPGGQIWLSAASGDKLVISVKDTGIGLSQAALTGVFEMFSQVSASLNRAEGGLGIGLALVKGLVELHGGSVEAKSDGPGKGCEFRVSLPRSVIRNTTPGANRSSAQLPEVAQARGRVLVADDNRDAGETLAAVLRMSGYEVIVAFNGQEALARAAEDRPDAIVLDIGMPGISGFEVASRIRREAWGQDVPLIAMTGWGQEHDKAQATAAGFDEHLTKPADPMVVTALLKSMVQESARRKDTSRQDAGPNLARPS